MSPADTQDPSQELKTEEYKQKNPNGLLPAVKIDDEFYYESGAIMEMILEKFGRGRLAPAPNTKSRGTVFCTGACMQRMRTCVQPRAFRAARASAMGTFADALTEVLWESDIMYQACTGELKRVCAGKFLQWIWFLEATFNPPLSELLHHKMLLPEDKKVKEVCICLCSGVAVLVCARPHAQVCKHCNQGWP